MRVSPHVRASVTADGVMFLDVASGRIFSANAIGAHIWTRLCEGWSESAIAREIAHESGVDEGLAASDVGAFAAELASRGFLSDADAAPTPRVWL